MRGTIGTVSRAGVVLAVLGWVLAAGPLGCLDVPLGDPDSSGVDQRLVGWWEEKDGGSIIYASAFDKHAYLVTLFAMKQEGGQKKPDYRMTTKAWLTKIGDMQIMTLKIVEPSWELQEPSDAAKRYVYYRITHTSDGVEARRLNESLLAEARTPDALAKTIADNIHNDQLFDAEPAHSYTSVPDSRRDELKRIVEPFQPHS